VFFSSLVGPVKLIKGHFERLKIKTKDVKLWNLAPIGVIVICNVIESIFEIVW